MSMHRRRVREGDGVLEEVEGRLSSVLGLAGVCGWWRERK